MSTFFFPKIFMYFDVNGPISNKKSYCLVQFSTLLFYLAYQLENPLQIVIVTLIIIIITVGILIF